MEDEKSVSHTATAEAWAFWPVCALRRPLLCYPHRSLITLPTFLSPPLSACSPPFVTSADTLDEKGDGFATSLYSIPEIGQTREQYRQTVANARAHDISSVTPCRNS